MTGVCIMTFTPDVFPTSFSLLYCPFPSCCLDGPLKSDEMIEHAKQEHSITIHNPEAVLPILDRYLLSLVERSRDTPNLKEVGLESDLLDHTIRVELQTKRLKDILNHQQLERSGLFKQPGECLFCREHFVDKYAVFKHMFQVHSFNIGQLDNLVFVDEFLAVLRGILSSNTCIYCNRTFPDAHTLRKHMRCKQHFKINSHDTRFDKYYIVNYMLPGMTWVDLSDDLANLNIHHDGSSGEEDADEQWEAALDDPADMRTQCLLCDQQFDQPEDCNEHMIDFHKFDLKGQCEGDFYTGVKLINYMRLAYRDGKCPFCEGELCHEDDCLLEDHHIQMQEKCKCTGDDRQQRVPREAYDRAEYLIPFYEDDNLISLLDD